MNHHRTHLVHAILISIWLACAYLNGTPQSHGQTLHAIDEPQDSVVRYYEDEPSYETIGNEDQAFITGFGAVSDPNEESADAGDLPDSIKDIRVGYDGGFVIASQKAADLQAGDYPFRLRFNGWGQLRHTILDSKSVNPDVNQFQLKRARLVFCGHAFTSDFQYFFQLDGRSSSGDDLRLLDYYLSYDLGHHAFGLESGRIGFRTGKWKMPFTMARYLSGREFEFADRSVASLFFDVNRSLAWGLYGQSDLLRKLDWEVAIFNGLVTGGAATGSAGTLDSNFAFSARAFW